MSKIYSIVRTFVKPPPFPKRLVNSEFKLEKSGKNRKFMLTETHTNNTVHFEIKLFNIRFFSMEYPFF